MTRHQAGEIVALLTAAYPHPPMTHERMELFTQEIALLEDHATGLEAARIIIRSGEWFPKISEFRQTYRTIAERRRSNVVRLEPPPRDHEPPTWVQVWAWCRWIRDPPELRALPQEREGFNAIYENGDKAVVYLDGDEYERLEQAWRDAGAPKWRSAEIMRAAGITA